MVEAAALAAGLATSLAILILEGRQPVAVRLEVVRRLANRLLGFEQVAAARSAWPWLTGNRLLAGEATVIALGALAGFVVSGLPALAAASSVLAWGSLRIGLELRVGRLRRRRQDAVLEAVRAVRQLLESGGVGVSGALQVLAERGPIPLRREFQRVAGAPPGPLQARAWAEARQSVAEPVFDLLSAAILIQRPGGGELAPLFGEVEASVTAVHEVEREAEALQVQARSAAALILALPLTFLGLLGAIHSAYLDPYRQPVGELFLAAMLAVMGAAYVLILRWLRLPGEPRLRLRDG